MKHLAKDKGSKVVEDAEEKVQSLLSTFNQHLRNKYDRYYFVFVGCEASNLVIVIAQLLLTNSFLGREKIYFQCHRSDLHFTIKSAGAGGGGENVSKSLQTHSINISETERRLN